MRYFNSERFSKPAYRFLLAGIFVILLIQLGLWGYLESTPRPDKHQVVLKSLKPNIEKAFSDGSYKLDLDGRTVEIKKAEIDYWVQKYIRAYSQKEEYRLDQNRIREYLEILAISTNREPVDAKFVFANNRAEVFSPATPGKMMDIEASLNNIVKAIANGEPTAKLVVNSIEPGITLEKINSLGINSLMATGESNFAGSSPARIRNIRIAIAKFNGLIIEPDQTFSFNDLVGPIDESSGYEQEKVIKDHKLVYEFGGGVCQVSTTIFRAAINAGFPIIERKNHAFAVQYYYPQGFDATIYPGITNLRFKNDSQKHVILQAKIIGTKLIFEIYGASDGRKVTVETPVQYDQKSDGSFKTYFTRKIVSIDGKTKEDRFDSYYRSPSLYPLEKNPLE